MGGDLTRRCARASDPSESASTASGWSTHRSPARGIRDPWVLHAMRTVPREAFVPASQLECAYDDGPLPIGEEQTISQPYVVAVMTELVQPRPGEPGPRDRHGIGLCRRGARDHRVGRVHGRAARPAGTRGGAAPGESRLSQCPRPPRRRDARLARARSLRGDHRDSRRTESAAGAARSARHRGATRDAGRLDEPIPASGPCDPESARRLHAGRSRGRRLCSPDRGAGLAGSGCRASMRDT